MGVMRSEVREVQLRLGSPGAKGGVYDEGATGGFEDDRRSIAEG